MILSLAGQRRSAERLLVRVGVSSMIAFAANVWAAAECVPPLTYIPLHAADVGPDANGAAALGTYERVSPDGRFILRSYSGAKLGKVSLMELPAEGEGPVKAYRTPFSNEAFPVQGTWRYLVDVTGEHYRFSDVLNLQASAQPLFKGGMTGFYAAASEMQGRPDQVQSSGSEADRVAERSQNRSIYIRSLSWPQNADSDSQGVGPLQITTIEVKDDGRRARIVGGSGTQFICQSRRSADGNVYALPMISVDGAEFSAIPQVPGTGQPSMRVYGLSEDVSGKQHPCDLRADMGFSPGKAVFGFPRQQGQSAWLTYGDVGYVYVFDRNLGQTFRLDHERHRVLASAFPGLTRDGRVIFGATWRSCPEEGACPAQAGYVIADPYQSSAYKAYWSARGQTAPKACITRQDIERERATFARMHGLRVGQ